MFRFDKENSRRVPLEDGKLVAKLQKFEKTKTKGSLSTLGFTGKVQADDGAYTLDAEKFIMDKLANGHMHKSSRAVLDTASSQKDFPGSFRKGPKPYGIIVLHESMVWVGRR